MTRASIFTIYSGSTPRDTVGIVLDIVRCSDVPQWGVSAMGKDVA